MYALHSCDLLFIKYNKFKKSPIYYILLSVKKTSKHLRKITVAQGGLRMFPVKNYLVMIAFVISLSACGGGGGGGTGGTSGTSGNLNSMQGLASCTSTVPGQTLLCGTAVATDGVTPLAGAEVSINSATPGGVVLGAIADPTQCLADDQGEFACVVPAGVSGDIDFVISSQGFENVPFSINIVEGEVANAGSLVMTADNSTVWVVVPGSFDGVQVLLAQLKNCTLNSFSGGVYDPTMGDTPAFARGSQDCVDKGLIVLDDFDNTSPYYAPDYLASNALSNVDALFINCDADYSGDSAIDTAITSFVTGGGHVYFSDLSDAWLTALYPGKVNFFGNDTFTGTISGNAVHTGLAAVVGNNFDVLFDLSVWTAIDTVAAGVTTFIQGDLTSVSNYIGVHPITVGWREANSSGCIYYTSYHIEGNSEGAPQELAMKYLIQNIGAVCT